MNALPGNVVIRSWRDGDVQDLVLHANDADVSANLRDAFPFPYSHSDATTFIDAALVQSPQCYFAITRDDRVIGGVGVELRPDVFRRSAEIGYWLGKRLWGRGIATTVVMSFTEYAFDTFDLVRVFAGVFERNGASARVLEKAGYELEGRARRSVVKRGEILDELMYAKVR